MQEKENTLASRTQHRSAGVSLRRTKADDMESVVALDAAIVGRARHGYFQRRLKAALDHNYLLRVLQGFKAN